VADQNELVRIASLAPQVADQFAARLAESGVHFQLEPADIGRGWEVQVYVPQSEIPQARQIEAEFIRAAVPDLPPDYNPYAVTSEDCPGCGTAIVEGVAECAECGLTLPD
jgi:hypothetical protein